MIGCRLVVKGQVPSCVPSCFCGTSPGDLFPRVCRPVWNGSDVRLCCTSLSRTRTSTGPLQISECSLAVPFINSAGYKSKNPLLEVKVVWEMDAIIIIKRGSSLVIIKRQEPTMNPKRWMCPTLTQYQNTNSSCSSPYISYRSSGEKLLKYQENLTWVIMFSILVTSLTDKLRSLLWLKGLNRCSDKENKQLLHRNTRGVSLVPKKMIYSTYIAFSNLRIES